MEDDNIHHHKRSLEEEYIYRLRTQAYIERRRRLTVAAATTLMALAGALAAFFSFSKIITKRDRFIVPDLDSHPAIISVEKEMKRIEDSIDELRSNLKEIKEPVSESALAARQDEIDSSVSVISGRLNTLESALQESPEKALSIPLLRKDLEDLNVRTKEYRITSKNEFDRLYAQQTWILGGIGTVLLAVAGGSITILLRSIPKPTEPSQAEPGESGNG